MRTLYNEWDVQAAAWIEALIDRRVLHDGPVDTRDIEDVLPSDLAPFDRVHMFAGIGTWDYALTLAGWPDDREVWTVSCPCQPFSAAGQRKGTADKRHLWPAVDWLVGQRRPHTILGEQVASKDGRAWFDHVQADLENRGYAVGSAVTPAAGYGAPHERHRLYFAAIDLAQSEHCGRQGRQPFGRRNSPALPPSAIERLADDQCDQEHQKQCRPQVHEREWRANGFTGCSALGGLADVNSQRFVEQHVRLRQGRAATDFPQNGRGGGVDQQRGQRTDTGNEGSFSRVSHMPGPTNGFWRDADWLGCRDDRWRPVEPGTFPLAHGSAARVGRLRGYGNGIVLPQAVAFIQSFLEGEAEWLALRGL